MGSSICYVRCREKAAELVEEFLHSDIRNPPRPGRLLQSSVVIHFGNTKKRRI
jgi:hypothetical protein